MNNKIIDMKNIPDSHKEERRMQSMTKVDTMMMHYRGTGVTHKINGRDNFGIVHVLDGEGNTVPEGKIEKTHMWCRDGKSELEMKTH